MTFLLKDPGAVLDYLIDWGAEYLDGDMLAASEWSVVPDEGGGVTVAGSDFDRPRFRGRPSRERLLGACSGRSGSFDQGARRDRRERRRGADVFGDLLAGHVNGRGPTS